MQERTATIDRAVRTAPAVQRAKHFAEKSTLMAELTTLPGELQVAAEGHALRHSSWLQIVAQRARAAAIALEANLAPERAAMRKLLTRLNQYRATDDRAALIAEGDALDAAMADRRNRRDAYITVMEMAIARAARYGDAVRLIEHPQDLVPSEPFPLAAKRAGQQAAKVAS